MTRRFSINTANTDYLSLLPHAAQLLLVSVYQQMEAFLNGVRYELKQMGHEWPPRADHLPLLDYTLQNLPGGLAHNKVLIGEERYALFEYYRQTRNAFVHAPVSQAKLARSYGEVEMYRKIVATQYSLDAPNPFEALKLDDYMLFTRLIKYIATDICRIGEPTDQALVKIIEWKMGKVGRPLENFLKLRQSKPDMQNAISRWFKAHYGITLSRRPGALGALTMYVENFPNKSARKREKNANRDRPPHTKEAR